MGNRRTFCEGVQKNGELREGHLTTGEGRQGTIIKKGKIREEISRRNL